MNPTCRVALLGSKFMGRTHSNAYLNVARFFDLPVQPVMQTICARDPKSLQIFADRWGWQNWSDKWQTVCTSSEIDLVDIGTPNDMHTEPALAALEAGKHVACEKPLAGTLDEARAMMQAAKKAARKKLAASIDPATGKASGLTGKQQTFVWFNYRRCPAVALAHQLVKEGRLGRIYHVRAAYLQDWGGPETPLLWRFQKGQAGSGAHGDLNAHIIDMARFITGEEVVEVQGAIAETFIKKRPLLDQSQEAAEISGKRNKKSKDGSGGGSGGGGVRMGQSTVDDAVLFLAKMKGGAVASFEASRLATGDKNANRIEIHGEHGALRFNFERMNELEWFDAHVEPRLQGWSTINVTRGADGHPYASQWWPDAHIIGYEHGFVNQAADMFMAIGGQAPVVPLPDFEDAYQTQRVLEAALISAKEKTPIKMSQVK